jgi:hypothetical protein
LYFSTQIFRQIPQQTNARLYDFSTQKKQQAQLAAFSI